MTGKGDLIRDQAFSSFAGLQRGEMDRAVRFIRQTETILLHAFKQSNIGGEGAKPPALSGPDTLNAAYWLWILGEYTNAAKDRSLLVSLRNTAEVALTAISAHWRDSLPHWLGIPGREPAIYLSNLAILYGAALAIQPSWTNGLDSGAFSAADVQRLLKEIRELLFAKMIKDGRVVSRVGSREINGDIVLAAVPFGLLGIEDRILIEALYVAERELIGRGVRFSEADLAFGGCERPALGGVLAWYYSEKGDTAKAKQLLERLTELREASPGGELPEIDPQTALEPLYLEEELRKRGGQIPVSPLAEAIFEIAEEALKKALQGREKAPDRPSVSLLHEPAGTNDPYVYAPHERSPRHPEEGQLVFVRASTLPFRPQSQTVWVEFRIGDGAYTRLPMRLAATPEGEKIWEAALGRFAFGQTVHYRFEAQEGGEKVVSEVYSFSVRAWTGLWEPSSIQANPEEIAVEFALLPGMSLRPVIRFHRAARESGEGIEVMLDWKAPDSSPGISGDQPETAEWRLELKGYELIIARANGKLKWRMLDALGKLVFETAQGRGTPPVEVMTDQEGKVYKARLNLQLQDGERAFGMGERYARMEYRGFSVDNHVYNEYRSQGLKTYMPVPFYISSQGYGCFLDTLMYSRFDFGSQQSDLLTVEAELSPDSPRLKAHWFPGQPLAVIRQFSEATARPVLPPKWSFGPWMSSNNWDSQAETMKQVELTERYEIPATVIVLEQWSDEATFYIFNDAQYKAVDGGEFLTYGDFTFPDWGRWPNPRQMVEELHARGLKVLLWQIPIQKFMYGITHEQKDQDEKFMLERNYHVRRTDGTPYRIPYNWFKDCLVLDFTNEEARRWWFKKRQYLLDEVGIDGFKTDGGECILGHDLMFADGTSAAEMHNRYPLDYIGSYYRFVQERTRNNGITFSRSGYTGAQQYPLHWAGDERSTYEAFRSSILAGLTSGMSGIPFWGWDLGGFHGDIPTAELFIRAAQMAAFCPVMQYHAETKGEFNQDRTPWNIAERTGRPEVIAIYKKFADIRMNLLPYVYAEAMYSSATGEPMMRAMAIEFPGDKACMGLGTQYMFGRSLLVAPLTEEGAYSRRVYFPEGRWLSLFGDQLVEGGRSEGVHADLDEIPVFIREDGIIPLNLKDGLNLGTHVGNAVDRYERLTFMMFPVREWDYRFADDLGNYVTLRGKREEDGLRFTVTSNVSEPVSLIVRGLDEVQKVTLGDADLSRLANPDDLDQEPGYFLRGNDLILRAGQGEQKVYIQTKSGGSVHAN
ncbi:TIM-barrel domain-containing protein [Paenibacillus ginsengihumi]|uniref:glycoside hydrolase family 31 protein n=1 Tax=Paenibacillus ginsengihumi TaxID=431596 RepID=UPI00036F71A1|nr:TIM-barrel domain-containing protein [Paenibacillus ginsengihumi]